MKHTIRLLEDDDYDLSDEVASEYDFAALRQQAKTEGRAYHGQLSGRLIRLAPDVSEVFTSADEVNEVLRQFIREKKAA